MSDGQLPMTDILPRATAITDVAVITPRVTRSLSQKSIAYIPEWYIFGFELRIPDAYRLTV